MRRALAVLLLMSGCSLPTSSDADLDPLMVEEFNVAKETLEAWGVRVWVGPDDFLIIPRPDAFTCGTTLGANGCYDPNSRRIDWNTKTPTVLRHEFGHGILHIEGFSCWREYEHLGRDEAGNVIKPSCLRGLKTGNSFDLSPHPN